MERWKNPSLSLGERCVLFSENEMNNNVKEDYFQSYSSKRIVEYFSICTRLINGKEIPINLKSGNWCCAAVSFSLYSSLLNNENKPHNYRVGVIEIVSELKMNSSWKTVKDIFDGLYTPSIGDLVIFDRSIKNKPETSWFRHIGRIFNLNPNGFECISGNNNGTWKISKHKFSQLNLIGFGDYSENLYNNSLYMKSYNLTEEQLAPKQDTGDNLELDNFSNMYNILKS